MVVIYRLLWDAWNITHIARHAVRPEEVEEVCHSEYIAWQSYQGRIILIGLTDAGRMLAVILSPQTEEGVYYVVTARTASKKERRLYRQEQGGKAQ